MGFMQMQEKKQTRIKDILENSAKYDTLLGFDTTALLREMEYNLFPLSESDLIAIENEKSYTGYYAFNVPIPAELIKEVISTAKKSDNYLSRLVLKYPYIQLIVEYWIINQLYELYLDNPKLIGASVLNKSYQSFNQYLSYHYLPFEEYGSNHEKVSDYGYTATFESMAKLIQQSDGELYRTLSFKPESEFKDTSRNIVYDIKNWNTAVNKLYRETDFTLYDFIYDLFYSGICKALRASFQSDMITKLLPLAKLQNNMFKYKEIRFDAMYGRHNERELFPNINRKVTRLEFVCPKLQAEECLIVKSTPNQFMYAGRERNYNFQNDYYNPKHGIVYDELWEICGRSIEQAKANKDGNNSIYDGESGIYKYSFYIYEPRPPERHSALLVGDENGNIIEEIETYSFEETESILATRFYYTHNFHVTTPAFYIYRKLHGYDWDRISPMGDNLTTVTKNLAVPSLYYKYAGIQLILLSFLSTYGWCK